MNAFADWLFNIILGWTRGLANAGWNLVANHSSGLSELFGRIWLPLLLILLVAGTLFDYIVWFIRWRPQRTWRTWRTHRARRRDTRVHQQYDAQVLEHADMPEDYLNMMSGWVQEDQDNMPLPEDFHAAPLPEAYAPVPVDAEPQLFYETPPAEPEINIAWRPATGVTPKSDAVPGQTWPPQSMQHPGYPEETADLGAGRRRRSERRRGVAGALNALRGAIRRKDDDQEDDVPRDSAFRAPVYPKNYQYDQSTPRGDAAHRDG